MKRKNVKYCLLILILIISVSSLFACKKPYESECTSHIDLTGDGRCESCNLVIVTVMDILKVDYDITTSIIIKYYVALEGEADLPEIKLLVWKETPENKYYAAGSEAKAITSFEKESIDGRDYAVFSYSGCRYTDIATPIYARAVMKTGDGQELFGKINKYSILSDAYRKLGKIDLSSRIDDEVILNKLSETVKFCASMQSYLEIDLKRPIDGEWYSVRVENGTLPDGFNEGIYFPGDSIVLTADAASGKSFSHWELNGENIGSSETIEITVGEGHAVYKAVFK